MRHAPLLELTYPDSPEAGVTAIAPLWRADFDGHEPLLTSDVSDAVWHEASLRWLVAPEAVVPTVAAGDGPRVGLADVAMIKSTADMFAQLDDRFGGDHARQSLIQYLSRDVAPLLSGQYTQAVGRALFAAVAEATLLAGWMSYDACHHGLAQRYFVHALRLAQDGDDRRPPRAVRASPARKGDLADSAALSTHRDGLGFTSPQVHSRAVHELARKRFASPVRSH
ncbi:hypothetical protein ACH4E8_08590 [Streptomyces sp. NPDC017979]|uniref:hypothetical protein n=1 Tax=Streptomyces sp. NPDC017979 TaxID=3365024 RepID=UPI0037A952F0